MLRAVLIIAAESCTLLRRDRMFGPALLAATLLALFAGLASAWSVEDFTKILFDVGFFGLQLLGSGVALFWGARSVSDSRQDGALEVRLAAPLSRTAWILGRYLGLAASLVLLSSLLLAVWQLGMAVFGYGLLTSGELITYMFMVLGWLVLAAASLCLGVIMRFSVALFTAMCLWLTGLASAAVVAALRPETPQAARVALNFLARVWDLQQFNLIDQVLDSPPLSLAQALHRGGYGAVLIALMVSFAAVAVNRGDACA